MQKVAIGLFCKAEHIGNFGRTINISLAVIKRRKNLVVVKVKAHLFGDVNA
jgi:hypothetical protein